MTSKTFSQGVTIDSPWLNDVNTVVYNDTGGPGGLSKSSGSSLVGFIQSGAGAVARTAQSKLRDVINLADYGALGDGATNDAAAIQAAHDALPSTGGTLIGNGNSTFILGSAIAISKPVVFKGAGRKTTLFLSSGTNAVFSVTSPLVRFEDLQIGRKSGNVSTIPNLITGSGAHQIRFVRCLIGGADTADVDIDIYFSATFDDCIFNARTAQVGKAINSRGSSSASTNLVINNNCEFNNYNQSIDITNTFGTRIFQSFAVGSMRLVRYNSGQEHVFIGNWAESGGIASTFAIEIAGIGATQIVAMNTRLAGTPITDYVTLTGGSTQGQIISLEFAIGPAATVPNFNLQGSMSIPQDTTLGLNGSYTRYLKHNSSSGLIEVGGSLNLLSSPIYNVVMGGKLVLNRITPAYGASVAIDASLGNEYDITVTNGTAFTVANPTNPTNGQRITITIRNTFGVIGAVTWDTLYKLSAWTQPANGFSRSIDFRYDGTNWVQVSQTGVDVPN